MGLKVKAIERNVSFVKDGEPVWRYVMQACWDAAGEVIKAWASMTVFLKTLTIIRFFSQILPFSKKEVLSL